VHHTLHLLLVDVARADALAADCGGRWLLPLLHTSERVRAGTILNQWLARHRLAGHLIGQWVGKAASPHGAMDWLGVIRVNRTRSAASSLHWVPLASLASSTSWLPYQQWAIRQVTAASEWPAVSGPFGTVGWLDEAISWADIALGVRRRSAIACAVPLRATPYEVVLQLRTARETVYFKGLAAARAAEATLTIRLAARAPRSFARTIAMTTRPDGTIWWLMEACPGSPLAAAPTPDRATRAVTAYAAVQQRIIEEGEPSLWGDLPRLPMRQMLERASDLLRAGAELDGLPAVEAAARFDELGERIADARAPESWIYADFDPRNVFIDGDEVRFIDLSDCWLGPAPLGVATFVRRMKVSGTPIASDLYDRYEGAWKPRLALSDRWRAFELGSLVAESYLAWNRVLLKTARGEIHDVIAPARRALAGRLIRALGGNAGRASVEANHRGPERDRRVG
jgi:hypothetical protein